MKHRTFVHLILAITIVFFALGAYALSYSAVGHMSQRVVELDTEIRMKNEDSLRITKARETLATLQEDESSIDAYLVREEEIVPFLGRLETLGSSLGSSLEVVSVSADANGTRGKIRVAVNISGSFQSVVRTLGAIEYGPYDSAITNVTLDTGGSETGQGTAWSAAAVFVLGTQRTTP